MLNLLANINFQAPEIDPYLLLPVLVLGGLVALALCLELRDESDLTEEEKYAKPTILWVGAVALVGLIAYYFGWDPSARTETFNHMLLNDPISRGSGVLICICALLAILAGPDELERYRSTRAGEYCALIFSSSLGMVLMSSADNTIVMFLGLELFSLALYLLCIFIPDRAVCRESGLKYFLLSSAASAILLYGLALSYGATGTTWLSEMQSLRGEESLLAVAGTIFVLCGLLFKLAVVPFHFWAPDVYDGAPTTVTAYMSVATKVAAVAALWRFLGSINYQSLQLAGLILFTLSALTILAGNFLALSQTKVKRMLAYSGVANAGYLLIAPVVGQVALAPMFFFLSAYLFGNVGAFLALAQIEAHLGREVERKDLNGLFQLKPWLAGCFAICLVSLAGLPPAAGFIGKFFLFGEALGAGQLVLPIVGIAGSLVGAAYYLGTASELFVAPIDGEPSEASKLEEEVEESTTTAQAALTVCALGVLYLGLNPSGLISFFGG